MKKYSNIERVIGKKFDSFPKLRRLIKNIYQHINYWLFKEKDFEFQLHSLAKLVTPNDWANVSLQNNDENEDLFFGYYDKSPWSSDMSKVIFHRLSNKEEIEIMIYDRDKNARYTIGTSKTWNYQQGSMAQWLPKSTGTKVVFNDLIEGNLATRIIGIDNETNVIIPWPIQTLHPNGREALTLNYKRLYRLRAQYGYSAKVDNFREDLALKDDGIWKVDLETSDASLILNLDFLCNYSPRKEMKNSEHKINHIMYSPSGEKFVFMHRWLGDKGKFSRLYVADTNGRNIKLLLDERMVSHYFWRDEEHVLAWARTKEKGDQYYLINVISGNWTIIGEGVLNILGDGHPSFSPDKRWIVTDTYPDKSRKRHLLLYEVETGKLITVGRFFAPMKFNWDTRVDLHPRWSPDGKMISIDSCHEGKRYSYIIDVSNLLMC